MHGLSQSDARLLHGLIARHAHFTQSPKAKEILADWGNYRARFVKVMPVEYRRALQQMQITRPRHRAPGRQHRGRGRRVGMGKPTGFLEYQRRDRSYEPVDERLKHYHEFVRPLADDELRRQGGRCMDCGTPFCHHGCPVNNIIPDWNELDLSRRPACGARRAPSHQ